MRFKQRFPSPLSPPVAAFSASPTTGTAALNVAFTDTSSGSVTAWNWSFGDGTTSTTKNPSHTYSASGTYSVSLTCPGGSKTVQKPTHYRGHPRQWPLKHPRCQHFKRRSPMPPPAAYRWNWNLATAPPDLKTQATLTLPQALTRQPHSHRSGVEDRTKTNYIPCQWALAPHTGSFKRRVHRYLHRQRHRVELELWRRHHQYH